MQKIAPNLSAVVGTATASKLMGSVGGLKNLCKLTANAILGLGSNKKADLPCLSASLPYPPPHCGLPGRP
jgi:U4/U6 small nuclear ribonucleoprotein PRP31